MRTAVLGAWSAGDPREQELLQRKFGWGKGALRDEHFGLFDEDW